MNHHLIFSSGDLKGILFVGLEGSEECTNERNSDANRCVVVVIVSELWMALDSPILPLWRPTDTSPPTSFVVVV